MTLLFVCILLITFIIPQVSIDESCCSWTPAISARTTLPNVNIEKEVKKQSTRDKAGKGGIEGTQFGNLISCPFPCATAALQHRSTLSCLLLNYIESISLSTSSQRQPTSWIFWNQERSNSPNVCLLPPSSPEPTFSFDMAHQR